MDKQLKERLLGAAILVGIVVLLVPALLTGPRKASEVAPGSEPGVRSVEIEIPEAAPEATEAPLDPAVEAAGAVEAAPDGKADDAPQTTQDPAGGPAAAVAADAAPDARAAPAPAPESGWAVQVAALSKPEAARELAGRLKERGYPAFVMDYRADGRVFHRVRVGPEATRAGAETLARRLAADGQPGTVVAHP